MSECNHFWLVTCWFRAIDESTGAAGLRASKILCANCGSEIVTNIMGGFAAAQYQPKPAPTNDKEET